MVRSIALTGLFVMACVAVLWIARSVFIPLTFALMLSFVFRPFVRLLERGKIPAVIGGTVVVLTLVVGAGAAVTRLAEPAATWAERLPRALQSVERKVRPLRRPVDKVSALAESVERITTIDKSRGSREVRVEEQGFVSSALETFATLAGAAVVMIIGLYFMLIWGDGMLAKVIAFVPDLRSQRRAGEVIRVIERRMSTYLGTICAINLVLGVAVAISTSALGMPNALLWGVLAAILNFVPYFGSLLGVAVLAVAALATFSDPSQAIWPPLAYLALTAFEGNIVTPVILGRQFRISPLVIFVWLVFWAWLWGVSGGILAVPLLMLIKLTCEQSPSLAPVVEFLRR
jgi:predicted PurR-regulated permease PerM